jgi:hypothetical protein
MKSVGSAYGSRNAQQQAQFERLQFKMASADYYDRVSRGVYVQSGFEPDKFAGPALRHSPIWTFPISSNAAMDFRGLELLNGLSIRSSKPLMHVSRNREFSLSVREHE